MIRFRTFFDEGSMYATVSCDFLKFLVVLYVLVWRRRDLGSRSNRFRTLAENEMIALMDFLEVDRVPSDD